MHINNQTDFRKEGGLSILKLGVIHYNEDKSFTVCSQTFADKKYTIELLENIWVCSCPDFEYRKIESCKHIYAVKLFTEQQQKSQIFAEDAIKCDNCGSIKVMRYGSTKINKYTNARIVNTSLKKNPY